MNKTKVQKKKITSMTCQFRVAQLPQRKNKILIVK